MAVLNLDANGDFDVGLWNAWFGSEPLEITSLGNANRIHTSQGSDIIDIKGNVTWIDVEGGDNIVKIGKNLTTMWANDGHDDVTVAGSVDWINLLGGDNKLVVGGDANQVYVGDGQNIVEIGGNLREFAAHGLFASGHDTVLTVGGDLTWAEFGAGDEIVNIYGNVNEINLGDGRSILNVAGNVKSLGTGYFPNLGWNSWADIVDIGGDLEYANLTAGNNKIHVGGSAEYIEAWWGNDKIVVDGDAGFIGAGDGVNCVLVGGDLRDFSSGASIDKLKVVGNITGTATLEQGENFAYVMGDVNRLYAGQDDDYIVLNQDVSYLDLGNGYNNLWVGGKVTDAVWTGTQDDAIYVTEGANTVGNGWGDDHVHIGSDVNYADLSLGHDTFWMGGTLTNALWAGSGNDVIYINKLAKDVNLGGWDDKLTLSSWEHGATVNGEWGNDTLNVVGVASNFTITQHSSWFSSWQVITNNVSGDAMTLYGIEKIKFVDSAPEPFEFDLSFKEDVINISCWNGGSDGGGK